MRKFLAILLSILMVCAIVPMSMNLSLAETEEVEILTGGEWVQGFWTEGAISTATEVHQKRSAYNVLLKVKSDTVYTFETRIANSVTSINIKEHNANKEQIKGTNISLSQKFTFTTSADTEYIGISLWNTWDAVGNTLPADHYNAIKADIESGNFALSIKGPAPEADGPVEDTTVPSVEPEEPSEEETESTSTTTTTTVSPSVPQDPSEEVEFLTGGEWVQGFWSNGAISTATEVHKKRSAYNALLKVEPNTTYTFKTKTSDVSANSINIKEHNANKEQVKNSNLQAFTLGANFTATFTTSAETEYLGISFWNSYEDSKPSDHYNSIKSALENGEISLSIKGVGTVIPVERDGKTTDIISVKDGASIRLNETNGMRFYATLTGEPSDVDEMGFIIAPKDIVEGEYFTMDDDHIKVKYDHKNYPLWKDNQFVGSIVNVADKNLARDFVARAYVVIDGVTYYAKTTCVRNLAAIADEYISDANGGFDALDTDTQALVEKWAKAND